MTHQRHNLVSGSAGTQAQVCLSPQPTLCSSSSCSIWAGWSGVVMKGLCLIRQNNPVPQSRVHSLDPTLFCVYPKPGTVLSVGDTVRSRSRCAPCSQG